MIDTIKCKDTVNLYPTLDPNITDVFDDGVTLSTSNNSMLAKMLLPLLPIGDKFHFLAPTPVLTQEHFWSL
jgi:hypothetical protein